MDYPWPSKDPQRLRLSASTMRMEHVLCPTYPRLPGSTPSLLSLPTNIYLDLLSLARSHVSNTNTTTCRTKMSADVMKCFFSLASPLSKEGLFKVHSVSGNCFNNVYMYFTLLYTWGFGSSF